MGLEHKTSFGLWFQEDNQITPAQGFSTKVVAWWKYSTPILIGQKDPQRTMRNTTMGGQI